MQMTPKITTIDWARIGADLTDHGHADIGPLIDAATAAALSSGYDDDSLYRSHIHMARHGFGKGEYKYFANPLPQIIKDLRQGLYPPLAAIANRWEEQLATGRTWPDSHLDLINQCHEAGQTRPTPLILRYGPGDFNALHQDIYGDLTFPLQVVILLSAPDAFEGGAFVLTEQRPRMQSRAEVVTLRQGHGVVFPVNERPRKGTRGFYRVKQRHGVSRLLSGQRHTLGLIFHDAT